jgi:hypothetical protein
MKHHGTVREGGAPFCWKTAMTIRISGYDPETGICWQFGNKGDRGWRCKCPACSVPPGQYEWAWFGRCHSGKRWFWAARLNLTEDEQHGWADTEELDTAAAIAVVHEFRAVIDKPLRASFIPGCASETLKELNKAKRTARPPSDAKGSKFVEYLYGHSGYSRGFSRFQIVKKTAKRIYYLRRGEEIDHNGEPNNPFAYLTPADHYGTGFVDRQKMEREGNVHSLYSSLGYLSERWRRTPPITDLRQLKAAMAAAHPDKGGSSAAFIEARTRYVEARRRVRFAGRES